MDEVERTQKSLRFPIYDKDVEILENSEASYKVLFEAVSHLNLMKN